MDELRNEYRIEVQARLQKELGASNSSPEEKPKKDGGKGQETEKKADTVGIMDILNLANENKGMPQVFQNRLNEFNAEMLEENRLLNSKINAVRLTF